MRDWRQKDEGSAERDAKLQCDEFAQAFGIDSADIAAF